MECLASMQHWDKILKYWQPRTSDACLSETNLDWNRSYVKYNFLSRQHKTWKHAATTFSAIEMESSSDYMTGGTLTSTVDKRSSRVYKKQPDSSGMG
jgi:hypothetical protein